MLPSTGAVNVARPQADPKRRAPGVVFDPLWAAPNAESNQLLSSNGGKAHQK